MAFSSRDLGPIVPVVSFTHSRHIKPVADILSEIGVGCVEITLRTPVALEAITFFAQNFPDCRVGAGTVINEHQLELVVREGAQFVLCPGLSAKLIEKARALQTAIIPGVATSSEIMRGLGMGLSDFKFFPAAAMGGVETLRSLKGPFPDVWFCPTGGITMDNFEAFLMESNVFAVGMTSILPNVLQEQENWGQLKKIASLVWRKAKALR